MQIKTTMRYNLMLVRMAAIKKSTNNKCWRRCRERGTFCWWECILVQPLWRIVYFKNLNTTVIQPSNPTSGHTHQGNQNWKRHVYPNVHHSTVYNSQDMKQPRCPSADKWIRKLWYIYTMECYSVWISSNEVDETGAYYTEWSKPERETPIQYINTYIWMLMSGKTNTVL